MWLVTLADHSFTTTTLQVIWLMGAPAGLKLHAELSSLLGSAALMLLRATRACYAALAPALLPQLLGEHACQTIAVTTINLYECHITQTICMPLSRLDYGFRADGVPSRALFT